LLVLASCDTGTNGSQEQDDFYYVEYEIFVYPWKAPDFLDIIIATENGFKTLDRQYLENTPSGRYISIIVGPVSKGFSAFTSVYKAPGYPLMVSIKVSKNNEPFVYKTSTIATAANVLISVSYTIDF
jgi:hypothetical protein